MTSGGPRPPKAVDWPEAHARLAALARSGGRTEARPDPEAIASLLAERARALAVPAHAPLARAEALEVLVFMLGEGSYAIESRFVQRVSRCGVLSRIPEAPPFMLGLTNFEGEVLVVVDLAALLDLPASKQPRGGLLLVLGDEGQENLGLRVDQVDEIIVLETAALYSPAAPPAAPAAEQGLALRRAVTGAGCLVIDGRALLRDLRLLLKRPERAG
jgi:chemotaxis signal transduction protein